MPTETPAKFILRIEAKCHQLGKPEAGTLYLFMPCFTHSFRNRVDWMVLGGRNKDTPLSWSEVVAFAKGELYSVKWGAEGEHVQPGSSILDAGMINLQLAAHPRESNRSLNTSQLGRRSSASDVPA